MKKILPVFVCALLLSGCSLFSGSEDVSTDPVVGETEQTYEMGTDVPDTIVEDFYFDAGEEGLVLRNVLDEAFSKQLSTKKILFADIKEGILTFTEETAEGGADTQTINLSAYTEFLNTEK
jgi:hypothetical protein